MCITLAVLYLLQRHAFENKQQLIIGDQHGMMQAIEFRHLKCSLLQPLVKNGIPVTFKSKQFDPVAALAQKYKNITTQDITFHVLLYNRS